MYALMYVGYIQGRPKSEATFYSVNFIK